MLNNRDDLHNNGEEEEIIVKKREKEREQKNYFTMFIVFVQLARTMQIYTRQNDPNKLLNRFELKMYSWEIKIKTNSVFKLYVQHISLFLVLIH